MHTPSLRRRVIVSGSIVLAGIVLGLQVFIALNLQEDLEDALAEVLETRAEVAREVARSDSPIDVPARLTSLGIPAIVTLGSGEQMTTIPEVPNFGDTPPGPVDGPAGPFASHAVPLPDGGTVEVLASRAGVDATMRQIYVLMAIGTLAALALGWWALRWTTSTAMEPLSDVVAAARRTASGVSGERLHADQPDTELGRLAVAYDAMLDELEDAIERAVTAEAGTRRFLDDAAHQLRTPIAGIRASVESLLNLDDSAARDRLMSNVVRETARASQILRSLLMIARLDADGPRNRRPADVVALVEDEIDRATSLAPELAIACHVGTGSSRIAVIDATGIREATANLLDNARRHATTAIDVEVEVARDHVRVRVNDDGPGVDPGDRQRVFERFASMDGRGGAGLGLPIARGLAERHGGRLTCDDDGFEIWIPAGHTPEATPSTGRESTQPAG